MDRLQKVLKVVRVFEILVMVAFITCFVGTALAGILSGLSYAGILKDHFEAFFPYQNITNKQGGGIFLSNAISLALAGLLLIFIYLYLKMIRETGSPFSKVSAIMLRRLAFRALIIGAIMDFIPSIIYGEIHLGGLAPIGIFTGISLGLAFFLFSFFVEYGVSLEPKDEEE